MSTPLGVAEEIEQLAMQLLTTTMQADSAGKLPRLRVIECLRDLAIKAEARAKAMHAEIQDLREEVISGPLKAKQQLESAAELARKALTIEFDREGLKRFAGIQLVVGKEEPIIPLEGSMEHQKLLDYLINVPDTTVTKLDIRGFKAYVKTLNDDDKLYLMEKTGITFEQPKYVKFVEER